MIKICGFIFRRVIIAIDDLPPLWPSVRMGLPGVDFDILNVYSSSFVDFLMITRELTC